MDLLNVPDYMTQMQSSGFSGILGCALFLVLFYLHMFVAFLINLSILLSMSWGALVLCRLFGIPWTDGTTKGFINRS